VSKTTKEQKGKKNLPKALITKVELKKKETGLVAQKKTSKKLISGTKMVETTVRKRGRPPKSMIKKRGRPRKIVEVKPKKRGRPSKLELLRQIVRRGRPRKDQPKRRL
jgi:hypothetical protein